MRASIYGVGVTLNKFLATVSTLAPGSSVTTSLPSATSSASNPVDASSSSNNSNKSWIAGAVLGPVAGCAIIVAFGIWLRRKRARDLAEPGALPAYSGHAKQSHNWHPSELAVPRSSAWELQGSENRHAELPDSSPPRR